MIENINNGFLKGLVSRPKEYIAINSLSLFNLTKHSKIPKIRIKGIITVKRFGIKKIER